MKLNAVGVNAKNITKSVKFYELLGFKFQSFTDTEDHVEATQENGMKLMIDTFESMTSILGEEPRPSNHSTFALQYDSPAELNAVVASIKENGFSIYKEPWDAFWGQRYAIVEDPSGYRVDLYATL
jgi:uncharacterized glyoxalase superfamily protein PhnB